MNALHSSKADSTLLPLIIDQDVLLGSPLWPLVSGFLSTSQTHLP